MLTASACGSVFASPPPKCIMAAVDAACGQNKNCAVMMIVTNYTGDRLNFGIACERARVKGHQTEMIVVGEDCALDSVDHSAGRRGLAGTMFIHKIAGAMAEQGMGLAEMTSELNKIKSRMGTMGVSLSPCSVPGSGPNFTLQPDEMELGLGVHGEAGVKRIKVLSAKETVRTMMDHMTNPQSSTHIDVSSGDRVALMVNNLGGTSVLELNIVAKEAIEYLERRGVSVERAYCGTYMTSLEMAGVSITVLHIDDRIRAFLDFPTDAPGWKSCYLPPGATVRITPPLVKVQLDDQILSDAGAGKLDAAASALVYKSIKHVCERLVSSEAHLNDLDTQSGDGDCGSTVARGARAILSKLGSAEQPGLPVDCPLTLALRLGQIAEDTMGGSSGALYSLFFTGASQELKTLTADSLAKAVDSGLKALMKYGGAKPGQRTMIDPIDAASKSLSQNSQLSLSEAVKVAAKASEAMAQSTAGMDAQAGRASYVNKELLTKPDPGAVAVAMWMTAIADAL
ncbi:triokinase/FMN cyclase isoform X2 [Aplysia californica]|nr:triokinase/FMN cyclase isoform X2 [Aplysia californica]